MKEVKCESVEKICCSTVVQLKKQKQKLQFSAEKRVSGC